MIATAACGQSGSTPARPRVLDATWKHDAEAVLNDLVANGPGYPSILEPSPAPSPARIADAAFALSVAGIATPPTAATDIVHTVDPKSGLVSDTASSYPALVSTWSAMHVLADAGVDVQPYGAPLLASLTQ